MLTHNGQKMITITNLEQSSGELKLGLVIIKINKLNKFHEDWMIKVAARVLTSKLLMTDDGQKAITKSQNEHEVS